MIQLSPTAIAEINRLKAKAQFSGAFLRLRIEAGGCMDWYYALSLGHSPLPDEHFLHHGPISIAVDAASLERIENLVIDYSEDLMGGGFRFRNHKATQSCGCGNSFLI
jgi:iron-sulfur cluster assembly protein